MTLKKNSQENLSVFFLLENFPTINRVKSLNEKIHTKLCKSSDFAELTHPSGLTEYCLGF